jgi:hypothetical protein
MKTDGGQDAVYIICKEVSQKCIFSDTKIEKNPIVKRENSKFADK